MPCLILDRNEQSITPFSCLVNYGPHFKIFGGEGQFHQMGKNSQQEFCPCLEDRGWPEGLIAPTEGSLLP